MTFRQILTPFKNKTQQGYQLCEKNLKDRLASLSDFGAY